MLGIFITLGCVFGFLALFTASIEDETSKYLFGFFALLALIGFLTVAIKMDMSNSKKNCNSNNITVYQVSEVIN